MKYGAILADPPWRFETWGNQQNAASFVDRYYETTPVSDMRKFPVGDFAADNCVLFCWACWPSFPAALAAIEGWGFTYKTMAFMWVKGAALPLFPDDIHASMGMGYWTRSNTEPCILATRGKPKRLHANVHQVILDKRREHSRKPDCIYERIERLVDGPYLEMFARQTKAGWDSWGNEVGKFGSAA